MHESDRTRHPGGRGVRDGHLVARLHEQPAAPERPRGRRHGTDLHGGDRSAHAGRGRAAVQAHFPADQVANFRTITLDTLALVQQGDQQGAAARVTDLETAWDDARRRCNAADCQAWTFVDQQIDPVLRSVRAARRTPPEEQAINELLATLG